MSTKDQSSKKQKKEGTKLQQSKKIKSKEEQLKKKLGLAREETQKFKDQLLRTAAEHDNYKKRTEREVAQIIQKANEKLILELLPVVDDMERSLKSNHQNDEDILSGVKLIQQKLMTVLTNAGVEPLESIGQSFDVDKHDALLQIEKKSVDPDIVVEEHEKGYLLNGRVIRHAKVIVSK